MTTHMGEGSANGSADRGEGSANGSADTRVT